MEKSRIRDPESGKTYRIRNTGYNSCRRHYNSNLSITTASTAHQQQRFSIQVLVCSQQPLLLSQEHYSRIAITTAASNHSHNSGWRPHNSNLRRPRKNYKLGTAFFFLVLNFVVGSQL
jgi:hypothetical protein